MQVTLLTVGRLKNGPEKHLIDTYVKRCPWPVSIHEVEEKRPIKGVERMAREGDLLQKALKDHGGAAPYIIALDERGKTMRSPDFAKLIEKRQDAGTANLVFLIGGADGYAPDIKQQAHSLLSLGEMTWPHMMARVLICEQLYRASCILAGHPYHKD
ncbi:23S rRNA (pseudouridine(1915)-N(3))-methyltransferase RlmH [Paremcibacter congregatus]|jgi:23S rRNA (pseudouridine1915-N3)-methyltransferase|uniref:23S rRNA (pseudouridine(1915)-N(3))-methyltransferase RlmH n=1 Tax=Paremcibacter congregatus TaxID=2043170 RepID=UPI0030EF029B|tara:strand:- start:634 stop:1104 length:471 start_codon:yes stop_codon:yes gene_type:complete